MVFVDGQTYFERYTCSRWQRVPGGGATVLTPFRWSTTDALGSASGATIVSETDALVVVDATIASLGPGTAAITVSRSSGLPLGVTWTSSQSTANGSRLSWSFADWGASAEVTPPPGSPSDNGPGGNPC